MKKQVLIATGLAVLSTSAFASKARLEALGQNDDRGSFYVEDSRNIFRNAAKVNTHKNYITTEWGTASNSTDDSAAAPHAEGGFFREMGSFNYGVYMGSQIDAQNSSRTNYQAHDNGLDLFFGGDMGVQWGARVHYASGNTENTGTFKKEHSNFGLGLGMMMGDIEGYANIILSDESKGGAAAADKFEANGLNLGASYNLNGTTIFADYDKDGFDNTVSGVKSEESFTAITVGVGRIHEVSSTARLNMDLKFVSTKEETKPATATESETTSTTLPLTLGFEADATSWLTLRGSVTQNVIINNEEKKGATTTTNNYKRTGANSTDVSAGATLNFGKLKVDGSIGTTSHARNAATQTENGTLALDNVLTRVGVTYWF
ncbi:putative membrane protein [Halobacteriovorax marinus SJ]|uniref:Membrane protein n=1 Tax=Halobacteriovorax marinus (strain ATCC BAA-682 / DSM 15412 / SJ) TaxID=862908 RepID=E1WYU7_HALMS|nr:hypothetical protein [Halobacteriovorax marinus]CBW27737.1 putative membrane protein [Halobacteriovorax marinus SJ]